MKREQTEIYFIRHVQATGNVQKRFQGSTDNDITKQGEIQRQDLKKLFEKIAIDCVYSSPLLRARKTAEAVVEATRAPLVIEDTIQEIFVGPWENMPLSEIKEKWPKEFDCWGTAPWEFKLEGAETMKQVFDRCKAFVDKLKETQRGKRIAVVSHGGVMRSLLTSGVNKPITNITDIGWIANGSVSHLVVDKRGVSTLRYVNKYDHITPETVLVPVYAKERRGEK